ncbi:MAG TPA: 16S rRNA (uracil(1498)-N(3))-methyltransferase, partial [Candidatus Eremiobacteraceae bacterium]|nr:16S rRNA (uracil(1498)-N(3))-methyltransferase [Candidatus Eremiobacteraceae bacterium]
SAPRFFVDGPLTPGEEVRLEAGDSRHAAVVLRVQPGAAIVVIANGIAWSAEVVSVNARVVSARVVTKEESQGSELPAAVSLLQAVPKGDKMEFVVEKAVELGARRIVPVECARSYGGVSAHKLERWRKIARSAAQQSHRLIVPEVEAPLAWSAALQRFAETPLLVAHEAAERDTLARAARATFQHVALAVGPEGSFTDEEIAQARAAGAHMVSLGPTILRTETAGLALLSAVAALQHWW